jgi:hypothetical protein
MIIENIVKGSKDTTFHTFKFYLNGLDLIITKGSYFQEGIEKVISYNATNISYPITNELTHCEIWLTTSGISALMRRDNENFLFDQLINPIDRLAWFTVPKNCTSLNEIDVNVLKVV